MPDRPVFKRIADNLRAQIECGVYAKGSAIPSETSLMASYGVARMTVRAALGVLKEEGVLRSEQGRGVFVQEVYGRPASAQEREALIRAWAEGYNAGWRDQDNYSDQPTPNPYQFD